MANFFHLALIYQYVVSIIGFIEQAHSSWLSISNLLSWSVLVCVESWGTRIALHALSSMVRLLRCHGVRSIDVHR